MVKNRFSWPLRPGRWDQESSKEEWVILNMADVIVLFPPVPHFEKSLFGEMPTLN